VAAVCAGLYLAVQCFQEIVFLARLPLDAVRATALLLSFFALIPVYVAVALDRLRHHPGLALCGAIFGFMFVLFELGHRAIDLYVPGGLAPAVVQGIYLVLLLSHLLSSVCFALALRGEKARWDHLGQIAFAVNALRLLGRVLGGYAGVTWLEPLSGPLYFPAVALVMLLLTVWLARRAKG
jgi:hypothetical protein